MYRDHKSKNDRPVLKSQNKKPLTRFYYFDFLKSVYRFWIYDLGTYNFFSIDDGRPSSQRKNKSWNVTFEIDNE